MKVLHFFVFLVFVLLADLQAQPPFSLPSDYKIMDNQTFSGSTLYGRIDGGAELFLEYGFEQLDYYLVSKDGKEYNLDVYRMKDPFAAYGIYSIKRFRCIDNDKLTKFFCQTPHQLSFLRGNFFITIANDLGNEVTMEQSQRIADEMMKTMPVSCLNVPVFNDSFLFEKPGFPILLMGPLGFQNGLPGWESFFEGFGGYTCFYQQGEEQGSKVEMFQVDFLNEFDALKFIKSKGWNPSKDFQDEAKTWYLHQEGSRIIFAKGKIKTH